MRSLLTFKQKFLPWAAGIFIDFNGKLFYNYIYNFADCSETINQGLLDVYSRFKQDTRINSSLEAFF